MTVGHLPYNGYMRRPYKNLTRSQPKPHPYGFLYGRSATPSVLDWVYWVQGPQSLGNSKLVTFQKQFNSIVFCGTLSSVFQRVRTLTRKSVFIADIWATTGIPLQVTHALGVCIYR